MKRFFAMFSLLLSVAAGAKNNFSWIADSLKTIELVNVSATDATHATATVRIGFSNPGTGFEISNVSADFLVDGQKCFNASTVNIIAVEKKCDKTYLADINISIPEGANPLSILNVLRRRYKAQLSLDCSFKVSLRGGVGITLHQEIDLNELVNIEPFSVSASTFAGKFSFDGFDILYIDEMGTDSCLALLEMKLTAPAVAKGIPEFSFGGKLKFCGTEAIRLSALYDIDIKDGNRMYYIPFSCSLLNGFNPCLLLNMLKPSGNETLSIVFERPRFVKGVEVTMFQR